MTVGQNQLTRFFFPITFAVRFFLLRRTFDRFPWARIFRSILASPCIFLLNWWKWVDGMGGLRPELTKRCTWKLRSNVSPNVSRKTSLPAGPCWARTWPCSCFKGNVDGTRGNSVVSLSASSTKHISNLFKSGNANLAMDNFRWPSGTVTFFSCVRRDPEKMQTTRTIRNRRDNEGSAKNGDSQADSLWMSVDGRSLARLAMCDPSLCNRFCCAIYPKITIAARIDTWVRETCFTSSPGDLEGLFSSVSKTSAKCWVFSNPSRKSFWAAGPRWARTFLSRCCKGDVDGIRGKLRSSKHISKKKSEDCTTVCPNFNLRSAKQHTRNSTSNPFNSGNANLATRAASWRWLLYNCLSCSINFES